VIPKVDRLALRGESGETLRSPRERFYLKVHGQRLEIGIAWRNGNRDIGAMTNEEVHSTIFNQRWRKLTLRLTSGDAVTTEHPDYLFMPPQQNWILFVRPQGKGLQFIPTPHIASIELETEPVTS